MAEAGTKPVADAIREQIEFARHVYDTQQALIRQLDTKAGVFITLLVFLATTMILVAKDVCARIQWSGRGAISSWLYIASAVIVVLAFVGTAIGVGKVIRARGLKEAKVGLMFAHDILKHGGHQQYTAALVATTDRNLLETLAQQVFELSSIFQKKSDAFRSAQARALAAFIAWGVNSLVSVYMLTWR
jgi:hypothetical protein